MRPSILYPLFSELTTLPGIGPRIAPLLARAIDGEKVVDVLWHLPHGGIHRGIRPKVRDVLDGQIATLTLTILQHVPAPPKSRTPYRVLCQDDTGEITLTYFHAREDYLRKLMPEDSTRIISGKVEFFRGEPQISHPDYVVPEARAHEIPTLEPLYGLTAGLTRKTMAKAVQGSLTIAPDLTEWHDPHLVKREKWPSWRAALEQTHNPEKPDDISPEAPARRRLAFDELLATQLAVSLVRTKAKKKPGIAMTGTGEIDAKLRASLPFTLTEGQNTAIQEIHEDMASPTRMLRMLQGDVGSGKTVVALLSMIRAVESGGQAVLMAPTDLLARQHFAGISAMAAPIGLKVVYLSGREKGKARAEALAAIASGEAHIAIGTHALFQSDVEFHRLGLAVIDEQHRFGVQQRLMLSDKGLATDLLVMTATPIPRTLMLAAYGDMDCSRIFGRPPGRKPIDTRTVPLSRLEDVIAGVRRAIQSGRQIYWVCPLVEDSENTDLMSVEERGQSLKKLFGDETVGIIHGQMKGSERDAIMQDFLDGKHRILVATTVIEVGVDVPNASIMIIEHAERFGLSQLHQLRGRVGRGETASSCLLLYGKLGETAEQRLSTLRDSNDGFVIAEADLKLRGAGELLGTRQSGLPSFKMADLSQHADLLEIARDDARRILATDPDLTSERGNALRTLLYLFARDAVVATLRSG